MISIDDRFMSVTAPRLDAVTPDIVSRFRTAQRETKLLFDSSRQEATHAVLLPVGGFHDFSDAGALRPAEKSEYAFLFGDAVDSSSSTCDGAFASSPQKAPDAEMLGGFSRSPFSMRRFRALRASWQGELTLSWAPLVGVGIDVRTTQSPALARRALSWAAPARPPVSTEMRTLPWKSSRFVELLALRFSGYGRCI